MRVLRLPAGASPRDWGREHGESFRGEIQSLAELRTYLTLKIGPLDRPEQVLELADRHVAVLRDYDADLADELCGIAEGAGVTPGQVVVINHYTDLRDIGLSEAPAGDEGCSVLYSRSAGVLAQTWDMHASAIPYVMMLHVPERDGQPAAWLLSLTGCLGMAGLSSAGVAIAINNMYSIDAQVGVVWSALVRRALREPTAAAARDLVMSSPVGSGHHYMVADEREAFAVETSGTLRVQLFSGQTEKTDSFIHTNHCLLPEVAAQSRVPDGSTTFDRYRALERSLAERPVDSVEDAWRRLGSQDGYPRSVCTNMSTPQNPHGAATCAAVAIDLRARRVLACGGFPHNVEPEVFELPGATEAP